ncbi:chemotaxis protein CheW [Arenimonas terrae]|jgi:chemosensory pili system protein ChpC|uniref:Chemotaxis protein CheW n=1 Tax=Arenimonas terrae TaxID=2546226 RepID=A0A5C4RWJ0_9GAMM|nr:chemotaxis protein CheW [Arenimonas terrae]TNJ35335.1 chemotaxis protein CheW [Arenimonas terrae]
MSSQRDIRGVLITVTNGRLLLPNASVAEVITYSEPEAVENAPDWLLGRVRWRGWRLPLLSFSRLAGWSNEDGHLGAKVAVLKALGGNSKLPFFAVLSQGFPRLVTVSTTALVESHDIKELPLGVHSRVTLNDDPAAVPDLLSIELLIQKALGNSSQAA